MNTASPVGILPIRVYGDEILRKVAEPVEVFDDALRDYVKALIATMYERDGVGLAAPQTGLSRRIFIFDPEHSREGQERSPVVVINPVILSHSGEISGEEGCISIPDIYAEVTRHKELKVSWLDEYGQPHEDTLQDYAAVVFQHEFDHLNGVLFTDKVSSLVKLRLKRRLKDLASTTVDGVNIRVYEED